MSIQYVSDGLPTDLDDLLGPIGPPETRNAVPAATGNGVEIAKEADQLHEQYNAELSDLLGPIDSPLDRPLEITRFLDAGSRRQVRETTSLRQFANVIRATRAPAKADLPWCKLAAFGNTPTVKGALRHDANLIAVDGVEGDYDDGVVSVADACERLRQANLAAIVYTTPSHAPDAPRWRVLAPTSEPLTPDEREAMCERLNGALGGVLARESFTRSQAYYFGAVGEGAHHDVRVIDGRAIDAAPDVARIGRTAEIAVPIEPDVDDLFDAIEPEWERIRPALEHIPADDRDDWLAVGMALHAEGRGSDEALAIWSEWSKGSDKFDARDQARVWKSFGDRNRKPVRLGTLFDLAKRHGWNAKAPAEPSRLTFLSPSECEATPSRGYIVKGILAPGDVGCIFGAPGAGKSLIAPHLGYAMAQGREAFRMRTKPGRVFYVAAEDPHGMRGRITALKLRHGDADQFTLVEGVSDLLSPDSPDLAALMEAVEAQRPALVFLDTLAMAFPGLEENDAKAMGQVVAVARGLAQWGAAVVLIHHDTKAEGSTPRGHSLLNGALDMAMHITRDEFGIVRGKLTKNRNGTCDRDIAFTIDTETLGIDEDGDAITAALVNELAEGAAVREERPATAQDVALMLLKRLSDMSPDMSGHGPGWIAEAEWRAACERDRGVTAAEKQDSRRRAVDRIIGTLFRKGVVTADDAGNVRPTDIADGFDDLEAAA